MAHLHKQGTQWTIRFTYQGKKHRINAGTERLVAKNILKRVEATMLELKLGFRSLNDQLPLKDLLLGNNPRLDETATLADGITLYLKDCRLASSTLSIYRVHHRHLSRFFGDQTRLKDIDASKRVLSLKFKVLHVAMLCRLPTRLEKKEERRRKTSRCLEKTRENNQTANAS